jgi:outer membrane protein TolC
VNLTLRNWLRLGIAAPLVVCLVCSGCNRALHRPPEDGQALARDVSDLIPPAPPVDPLLTPSEPAAVASVPNQEQPPEADFSGPAGQGGGSRLHAQNNDSRPPLVKRTPQPAARVLTLEECRQLTLANNPDLHVEVWEQIARKSFADASSLKMYPHPGLAAEMSNQNDTLYPFQDAQSFGSSNPLKRAMWRYYVEARWSPTDALQAFYISRNECNDVMKAGCQRVRAAQKLVGTVDAAYYRLLSMQECLPLAERLSNIRGSVSRQAKELRQDRLADMEDYLRTEEKASAARFRLTRIRTELERQKIILAALMALSPQCQSGPGFGVAGSLTMPRFIANTSELEVQALKSRPEAQMEGLSHINSLNDLKRTTVKYFPKASAFYRYGGIDSYNRPQRELNEYGVLLYMDLLDWLANTKEAGGLKAKAIKTEQRMGAAALAISSEVRMAALRCFEAQEELQNINASIERANKQLRIARGKANVGVLENVAVEDAQGNVLQDEIDRIRAIGEANARLCELNCAMGTNYTEGLPCH